MFYAGGLAGLLLLGLWLYCIFDAIASEESLVRNLPKLLWVLIVIFLPTVGSVAWLALGRPERAGARPGSTTHRRAPRPIGPEDSPEVMARTNDEVRRLRAWEDDLRRREDDLRRREEDDGT